MEQEVIQQLSIANALYNLRVLEAAELPSDQARQVFNQVLDAPTVEALNANRFYNDVDWGNEAFLPALCRFPAVRNRLALAAGIPTENLSFTLALAFLYKLSSAIWRAELPTLSYPAVVLDPAARQQFKNAFANNDALKHDRYPLDNNVIRLIANVLDVCQLRAFQKLEFNALGLSSNDPLDILKNQTRFSERLHQEITRFIDNAMPTSTLAPIYGVTVHGYTDSPVEDNQTHPPAAVLTYEHTVAVLLKDYLTTGEKPHQHWTSLKLTLFEDRANRNDNEAAHVSRDDVLKPTAISYHHARRHSLLPVPLSALDQFLERIDRLLPLYQADLERYWRAPSADSGAKKIWADQVRHYLETEARLRVADTTLDATSHAVINAVLSHRTSAELNLRNNGASVKTYRCAFVDIATSREFPINGGGFLIETTELPPSSQRSIVTYELGLGINVFEHWEAYAEHLLARLADTDSRHLLFQHVSKADAMTIIAIYATHPTQLYVKKNEVTADIITSLIEGLLSQQRSNIALDFTHAQVTHLPKGLDQFSHFLDENLNFGMGEKHARLQSLRHSSVIKNLPDHTLSHAWAFATSPLQEALSSAHLSPPALTLPALDSPTLTDESYRRFALQALTTASIVEAVKNTLRHVVAYFPPEMPVTAQFSAQVLHKIMAHRLQRVPFEWQTPDSYRYKYYYLLQAHSRSLTSARAKPLVDSACLALLGTKPPPSELIYPYYSAEELGAAQAQSPALVDNLHREIGGGTSRPNLKKLGEYLNLTLLAEDESAQLRPSHYKRSDALFHELLLDLPNLHALGKVLADAASGSIRKDQPTARRALAVSVITDYLYPPTEQRPGYIGGLNLNSVSLGEAPVGQVRRALKEHLQRTFAHSKEPASLRLAFILLSARYVPELLIEGVQGSILYGQALEGVHLRHAVGCLEAVQPCSALGKTYEEIATYYADFQYSGLSENKKIAIALLKQLPTLHFAMCQGVIPQTDIAHALHDDSLKAAAYIKQQQNLEAQAFTQLAQIPPQRKEIAATYFKQSFPDKDPEHVTPFTEAELKKYFHTHPSSVADIGIGRAMKMTALQKYMSCTFGQSFTEEEIGLGPSLYRGCSIQTLFDNRFNTYKREFLAGMVSRMCLSMHALPSSDRRRILDAYKFITVAFEDDKHNWEVGNFGLIALYKESDDVQYAYEIFCPSGTVSPLRLTGKTATRINIQFSPDSRDELWHESPYLNVGPLNEGSYLRGQRDDTFSAPKLTVSFYTVRRQTQGMSRDEKIKFTCQKMVDSVFSKIVDLAYPTLRSPTPYERHKERLYEQAVTKARFVFPGYALYQDIVSGKLTAGTIIFSAVEALSLLLPFAGVAIKALRVSTQLGRVLITARSLSLSTAALAAAKVIKPLQSALPRAFLHAAESANPLGALKLLFQGGHKGVLAASFLLRFVRQELGGTAHLSTLVKLSHLPPLQHLWRPPTPLNSLNKILTSDNIRFFKGASAFGPNQLNVQLQRRLYTSGIDLSDAVFRNEIFIKEGREYIRLQNNIYEVRKRPKEEFYHIRKEDIDGPFVRFDAPTKKWMIVC
ncbi:hypothetical protein [Pseudomonas sp. W4I3]|uniref:hypothetical protein n=1 Tax=Pseudomonas sp. W4I3 TaxID=3042294 RepID=UPI00278983B1|nr:hypothetical protein [Pseudomonas sp. W4I3]MDQ0739981.1 hypothetical protein [Pseudomonas sp. W4I3]